MSRPLHEDNNSGNILDTIHIEPLNLIATHKTEINACASQWLWSDTSLLKLVQLPVVDPRGTYSHGYIGADGKKEDLLQTRMHEPDSMHGQ